MPRKPLCAASGRPNVPSSTHSPAGAPRGFVVVPRNVEKCDVWNVTVWNPNVYGPGTASTTPPSSCTYTTNADGSPGKDAGSNGIVTVAEDPSGKLVPLGPSCTAGPAGWTPSLAV